MSKISDCELPEHDPITCPIEQYLPSDDCGGTAPVVQEVVCEYPGMQYSENDGEILPVVNINIRVTDPDGDLTSYELTIEVDAEMDGVVSQNARSYELSGETSDGICDTDESNLGIDLYLKGGFPYHSTEYEWYFVVKDASGMASQQFMHRCMMPDQQGNPIQ